MYKNSADVIPAQCEVPANLASQSLPLGRNLAALICGLPLRRQADGVRPAARAATSAAVRAASAADERPPGEAEVALLDAVPAVLKAVLAALDLVVNLQRRNYQ